MNRNNPSRNTSPLAIALAMALTMGSASAWANHSMPVPTQNSNQEQSDKSIGDVVDDATITATVKSKLIADEKTKAMNINVDTDNGVVTLAGTAANKMEKRQATQLAREVSGVRSVQNHLMISSDTNANPQTLSAKTKMAAEQMGDEGQDGWITTKIKSKLTASSDVSTSDISVQTNSGVVTLTGQVNTEQEKSDAVLQASQTEGVKSVDATGLMVTASDDLQ